jgi:hypothetical protein
VAPRHQTLYADVGASEEQCLKHPVSDSELGTLLTLKSQKVIHRFGFYPEDSTDAPLGLC